MVNEHYESRSREFLVGFKDSSRVFWQSLRDSADRMPIPVKLLQA
nr:MAG TPA: hypothetical protein [Caudoviricetes sp.]